MITCWERADLLVLLWVMLPCVFVTFPYGVWGQVRCWIVLSPDLCLLLYLCAYSIHFGRNCVNIFLQINFNIVTFWCLTELSHRGGSFELWLRNKEIIFNYTLFSGGMRDTCIHKLVLQRHVKCVL